MSDLPPADPTLAAAPVVATAVAGDVAQGAAYAWLGSGALLAALGVLLHLVSFGLESVDRFHGWEAFAISLQSFFEYGYRTWFANPAYWLAVGLYLFGALTRSPLAFRISAGAAVLALMLALAFWFGYGAQSQLQLGFFCWLASFTLQFAASVASHLAARHVRRSGAAH